MIADIVVAFLGKHVLELNGFPLYSVHTKKAAKTQPVLIKVVAYLNATHAALAGGIASSNKSHTFLSLESWISFHINNADISFHLQKEPSG